MREGESQVAPGEEDNWWWLTVRAPDGTAHLYELGQAVPDLDEEGRPTGGWSALTREKMREILAELGHEGPGFDSGWAADMAPGRTGPERGGLIEPKAYGDDGELLPIVPLHGTVLHLLDPS